MGRQGGGCNCGRHGRIITQFRDVKAADINRLSGSILKQKSPEEGNGLNPSGGSLDPTQKRKRRDAPGGWEKTRKDGQVLGTLKFNRRMRGIQHNQPPQPSTKYSQDFPVDPSETHRVFLVLRDTQRSTFVFSSFFLCFFCLILLFCYSVYFLSV